MIRRTLTRRMGGGRSSIRRVSRPAAGRLVGCWTQDWTHELNGRLSRYPCLRNSWLVTWDRVEFPYGLVSRINSVYGKICGKSDSREAGQADEGCKQNKQNGTKCTKSDKAH